MLDFNKQIIDEFRANRGRVQTMGFGDRLVLVHSIGAKSGAVRTSPLFAIDDGDSWLVAASAAGSAKNPDWYHNLLAHPAIEVEFPDDSAADGIGRAEVVAEDLHGADRDVAYARFTEVSPAFAGYEEKAQPRVIPVVRLVRRDR